MSILWTQVENENWTIMPAALAVNEAPPTTIGDQRWSLTLSGVAVVFEGDTQGMAGTHVNDWRRATLVVHPDFWAPVTFAIDRYGIPRLGMGTHYPVFSLEPGGWAPFAAVSSVLHAPDYEPYDDDPEPQNAISMGVAVDRWRPNHFLESRDVNNQLIANVFAGIAVDVAVYGSARPHQLSGCSPRQDCVRRSSLCARRPSSRARRHLILVRWCRVNWRRQGPAGAKPAGSRRGRCEARTAGTCQCRRTGVPLHFAC